MEIKDSGTRRQFDSGAVRDIAEGKGRCDLLPLEVVSHIMGENILRSINRYIRTGDLSWLILVIKEFSTECFGEIETAILEVSKHYEEGAKKYKRWNYRGLPVSSFLDSACRHIAKYQCGCDDEDHLAAAAFNILGAMLVENTNPELQDLPLREGKNTFNYFEEN